MKISFAIAICGLAALVVAVPALISYAIDDEAYRRLGVDAGPAMAFATAVGLFAVGTGLFLTGIRGIIWKDNSKSSSQS